jgi:hypothetical protein
MTMEQNVKPVPTGYQPTANNSQISISIDAKEIDNAVLKRLIAEVQVDQPTSLHGYNRTHNRHNRGR